MASQQIMCGKSYSAPVPALGAVPDPLSTVSQNASVMFNTDGSVTSEQDAVFTTLRTNWLNPNPDSTNAALYEIRRTQVSGTIGVTFTGTLASGTWYPLTAQRGVSVIANTIGRQNVSTYDIRLVGGPGTILATKTITVTSNL